MHEIDAETGKSRVHYYLASSPNADISGVNGGALAAYDGIFFGTYRDNTYYRYNPNGENRYNYTGEDACRIAGVSPKDVDFIAVEDPGSLFGWKYAGSVSGWKSGEYNWKKRVSGAAMSTLGAAYGNLYLSTAGTYGLYCVNPDTGEDNWKRSFPSGVHSSITAVGDGVYVTTYGFYRSTSGIYAVDALNPTFRTFWKEHLQN